MQKLIWRVQPEPTGRYRSFEHRGWPSAHWKGEQERAAAYIGCKDEYVPKHVKAGTHAPLTVRIARWHTREGQGPTFQWMRVLRQFATLEEAKDFAAQFLAAHPTWHPDTCVSLDEHRKVPQTDSKKDKAHGA